MTKSKVKRPHTAGIACNPFRVVHQYAQLPPNAPPYDVYPDDWDAPGVYEVRVPAGFDDSRAAMCALAGFNWTVPIKRFFMFELTVRDADTGRELEPDDDDDSDEGELAGRRGRVKLLGHLA